MKIQPIIKKTTQKPPSFRKSIQERLKNDTGKTEKKQDFYTYICVPANISYDTLKAKIAELNMQPQWELCNHVYYGVIQPFLTALPLGKTEQEIIEIFEAHTPANE